MTFRRFPFWVHRVAMLAAGIAIGIMCFSGTVLTFKGEIVAWAERDARRVTPPAMEAARLPLADLLKKAREAKPESSITSIAISADPRCRCFSPWPRRHALCQSLYRRNPRPGVWSHA